MEKFRPEVRAVGRRTMWAVFLAVLAAGLLISGAAMAAAPKIASTSPTHNQQNVDPAAPIVITFDQNISTDQGPDLLSGVDPKIKVTPATGEGGQALGLSASISGNKITITHSVKFAEGTAYQVSVERIKNDNNESDDPTNVTSPGPTLQNPWVFFIRDTKSPWVVSHDPIHGATNVSSTAQVVIRFSEPMDITTVNVAFSPSYTMVYNWDATNTVLTLTHPTNSAFQAGPTQYTVNVTGQDTSGNALVAAPTVTDANRIPFTFTTEDKTPPVVASTSPANGQVNVRATDPIVITFNEAINPASLVLPDPATGESPSFQLLVGDQKVKNIVWSAAWSNGDKTVTLQHNAPFASQSYTVKLPAGGIKDVAGNAIGADYTFSFSVAETTPPVVIDTNPGNGYGLTDVGNDKRFDPTRALALFFSEPMDPTSLQIEFYKEKPGQPFVKDADVSGVSLVWLDSDRTVEIRHDPLEAGDNSTYALRVLTAKDKAGNDLVASGKLPDKQMRFRTQDLTAPAIESVTPAHGTLLRQADGTYPNFTLVVQFTETVKIDTANVPQLSILYADGSGAPDIPGTDATKLADGLYRLDVAGSWSNNNSTVTLHVQNLAAGKLMVLKVLRAIDVNGNVGPRATAVANPWSYDIEDPGPPKLLGITLSSAANPARSVAVAPGVTPLVPQDVVMQFRFSKPIKVGTFQFTDSEATDQWGNATFAGGVWTATAAAFSGDQRVITIPLVSVQDASLSHTITIVSAMDMDLPGHDMVPNPDLNPFTFNTTARPKLIGVYYQRPTQFRPDNTGDGLRRDGTLGKPAVKADGTPDGPWVWEALAKLEGGVWTHKLADVRNAVVPLNSKIKLEFDQPMDITSVATPTTRPVVGGWSVTWLPDNKVAILDHSELFPNTNSTFTAAFVPSGPIISSFQVGSGRSVVGDPLANPNVVTQFSTVDAKPPSVTIEYLVNVKDDGSLDGATEVWAPLNGASNVPLKTKLRVTIGETLNASPVDNPGASADLAVNGNVWTADEKSGHSERQVVMGVQSIGTRETANNIVGSRARIIPVDLSGGVIRTEDGYEARANYKIQITARDTRGIAWDGTKWTTGQTAGAVNESSATAAFTTKDRRAPEPHHLTVAGTSVNFTDTSMEPDGTISITFTDAVDVNTVSISNLDGDSGDITFTGKEISADGKTVTFLHAPAARPTTGAPFRYRLKLNKDYKDLAGNVGTVEKEFSIYVPAETKPPQVVSVVSTRDAVLVEFSEPVIGVTDPGNGDPNFGYPPSAANPANYSAPLEVVAGLANPGAAPDRGVPATGNVSYIYYDPTLVSGQVAGQMVPKGWSVADRAIKAVSYNADTRTAILITEPFDKNVTDQPDYVEVRVAGIKDLSTNALIASRRRVTPQTGRHEFDIALAVTTNLAGASVDTNNILGVRDNAVDGYGASGEEDIIEVLPPLQNFVYLASHHSDSEPGWAGAGGMYTQDLMKTPTLNQQKVWGKIGISTDLGTAAVPATITVTWNLNVPGREVPFLYSVELLDPEDIDGDGLKSYDMRKISSFRFTIAADGIPTTRFLGVRVSTPFAVAKQFNSGFNLMAVPVKPINPKPDSVFFGLSPLVVYRYESDTQQYEFYPTVTRFDAVESGRGYWIQPRATTTINVLGTPLAGTQTVKLNPGWNLIGNPFNKPVAGSTILVKVGDRVLSVADAVAQGIIDENVLRYDNAQRVYVPSAIGSTTLETWTGYWVLATQAAELLISSPQ